MPLHNEFCCLVKNTTRTKFYLNLQYFHPYICVNPTIGILPKKKWILIRLSNRLNNYNLKFEHFFNQYGATSYPHTSRRYIY